MYLCILLEKYGECSYSAFTETRAIQTMKINGLLYFAKRNETKRNEMNNHVLKWTYPVSQQSDSSTR